VFVFMTGTWGNFRSREVQAILQAVADEGFVAASVEYRNLLPTSVCDPPGWQKTRCMFSTSFNRASALGAICADPEADCAGRGVVVGGHSQGGAHAAMARNFDVRIRGAWTMGFSEGPFVPCVVEGPAALGTVVHRILHNDRLRVFRGGHEGIPAAWSNAPTGMACAEGTMDCLKGNNMSGWYEPPDAELTESLNPNKHCFMEANPLDDGEKVDCDDGHNIDPKFIAVPPLTTYTSGLWQNVQWLKNTILPLGPQ
jgi:hypothetical protein